ncbi:hypothetical protein H8K38_03110 [Undibacterium sp. FT79W]|uniref:NHL domain-containing protein n=1 Tax=Undibacterium sp. FT79W TaxID=2762296 RepID=UPI00164CD800|nr:hypothetical protein [Undibacterium sp. FT79W]MBC3876793.1 hypothetical protein [Undibacterium sp. FT79W]
MIKDFGDKFGAGIVLDPLHNIYINYTGAYCGHFCVLPWGVMKIDSSGVMTFPFSYMKYLAADRMGNSYVADGTVIKKFSPDGSVIVLAGTSGVKGFADGPGNMASFYKISKGALDAFGNLYVVDGGENIIRKISASGVVTTLAGGVVVGSVVDGFGTSAGFKFIKGIAVDASGNIYVTDIDTIRKITPAGLVTTIVGKLGTDLNILGSLPGGLSDPRGLAIDSYGVIFVCSGGVILKIQL